MGVADTGVPVRPLTRIAGPRPDTPTGRGDLALDLGRAESRRRDGFVAGPAHDEPSTPRATAAPFTSAESPMTPHARSPEARRRALAEPARSGRTPAGLENEARAVARAPGGRVTAPGTCPCGGGCPRCAGAPAPLAHGGPGARAAPWIRAAARGPGAPLSTSLRRDAEALLGHDLRAVRVHRGGAAEALNRRLGSRAMALGTDVLLGREAPHPDTGDGRALLVHELAHVVQQRGRPGVGLGGRSGGDRPLFDPLPERTFESVDYRVRRLISEVNDHVDHGRLDEARALVPGLIHMVSEASLALFHADDAARALLRLGLVEEADGLLAAAVDARINLHGRHSAVADAFDILVEASARFVDAGNLDGAEAALRAAFDWLEHRALATGPFDHGIETPGTLRRRIPIWIEAMLAVADARGAAGDALQADRVVRDLTSRLSASPVSHRYAADGARLLAERGNAPAALRIVEAAEADAPPRPHSMISFAETGALHLLDAADAAREAEQTDAARSLYAETIHWVDAREETLAASLVNWGSRRRLEHRLRDRAVAGLVRLVVDLRARAQEAHRRGDADAGELTAAARAELERLRRILAETDHGTAVATPVPQPGGDEAVYRDELGGPAELRVTPYPGQPEFRPIGASDDAVLAGLAAQLDTVEAVYVDLAPLVEAFRAAHGRPPDLDSRDDRGRLWLQLYDARRAAGDSRRDALQAVIDLLGRRLRGFTAHTVYDVPDDMVHPLTTDLPRNILGQALQDCGVFAMRTAGELTLLRAQARLEFHFVAVPNHVYLGIFDEDRAFGWSLSNNEITPIAGDIDALGVARSTARAFDVLATHPRSRQVSATSESALRARLRGLPAPYRVPGVSETRARALVEEYQGLRRRISEAETRMQRVFADLRVLGPERGEAARRLVELLPEYRSLTVDTRAHLAAAFEALGSRQSEATRNIAAYFLHMDRVVLWLEHVAGMTHPFGDAGPPEALVRVMERALGADYEGFDPAYRGAPAPWHLQASPP